MKTPRAIALFIIFLITGVLATIFLLQSCKVNRHVTKISADTTHVVKQDSGTVSKKESGATEAQTWFKDTYISNDTTIYKTIIKEGGTINKNNYYKSTDSSWKKSIDSLKVVMQSIDKKSKTSVLSFWQILGLCGGGVILLSNINHFSIRGAILKIIKP